MIGNIKKVCSLGSRSLKNSIKRSNYSMIKNSDTSTKIKIVNTHSKNFSSLTDLEILQSKVNRQSQEFLVK
jgi:hypothetical protein